MKARSTLRGVVAAAAATTFVLAQPVGVAQADGAAEASTVAVRSLQSLYPGSTVVSSDTIRLRPGVLLTLPADQPRDRAIPTPAQESSLPLRLDYTEPAAPAPTGSDKPATEPEFSTMASYYGCADYYLCLFSASGYSGYKLSLYYCRFENLGGIKYPAGGYWNDKTSSWVNNQSYGTYSSFHNWDGYADWVFLDGATAKSARSPLPYDNKMDGVRTC